MASTLNTATAVRVRPRRMAGSLVEPSAWAPAEAGVIPARRRGERRRGTATLCRALSAGLMRAQGDQARERFLERVRRVLPAAASVTLRDWRVGEAPVPATADGRVVSVDVPTADPRIVAALDAVPLETRRFDQWDLDVLTAAGRLAGVLLEADSLRRAQRAEALQAFPARPDGAAPLIGSTPAMRALRDRIERLAVTDFTVLIEGECGR